MTPRPLQEHLEAIRARIPAAAEGVAPVVPISPAVDPAVLEQQVHAGQVAAREALWAEHVPGKFERARLEDWEAPALDVLVRWTGAQYDGVNLVVTGPVGTGKTHAGCGAARVAFMDGASFLFVPIDRMLHMLDWNNPECSAHRRLLYTVDVLLLDDLGAKSETGWALDQLYGVVNERWLEDRPIIATSNLEPPALLDAIGERTYSRLTGTAIGLKLTGEDRRRKRRT